MESNLIPDYLLLEKGLYETFKIDEANAKAIEDFFNQREGSLNCHQFDSYCVRCKKESTFKFSDRHGDLQSFHPEFVPTKAIDRIKTTDPITLIFQCQRELTHKYFFSFRIFNNELTKIGQYPSKADLELHGIEKYRKILSEDYRDFSKAIGLNSHGIGIGSFVYLRRIFENLIEETYRSTSQSDSIDENQFLESRMDEKIKLLEDYLPDILVENRRIYSILSKGIHELSEDECLEMFSNVKLAIELILDEKLAEKEKESKAQQLKQFVSSTMEKLKS